jgi:hypothetical protein
MSRLRRESRNARKNRYSASHTVLSTKSVQNDDKYVIFFIICKKITIGRVAMRCSRGFQTRFDNEIYTSQSAFCASRIDFERKKNFYNQRRAIRATRIQTGKIIEMNCKYLFRR